jgi:hypothetical protein
MNYLRNAAFGDLFMVTFVVAGTFQLVMSLFGIILAMLSPGLFQMNGVAATSPVQAVATLLFLLAFGLVVNAGMSAVGALFWLVIRKVVPRSPEPLGQE